MLGKKIKSCWAYQTKAQATYTKKHLSHVPNQVTMTTAQLLKGASRAIYFFNVASPLNESEEWGKGREVHIPWSFTVGQAGRRFSFINPCNLQINPEVRVLSIP